MQRWDIFNHIRHAVDAAKAYCESNKSAKPIVLTQCGGSLAYWLICRLHALYPDIFYIDLGQALNGWFFDHHELPDYPWMNIFKDSVIKNCRLESYYDHIKGD